MRSVVRFGSEDEVVDQLGQVLSCVPETDLVKNTQMVKRTGKTGENGGIGRGWVVNKVVQCSPLNLLGEEQKTR